MLTLSPLPARALFLRSRSCQSDGRALSQHRHDPHRARFDGFLYHRVEAIPLHKGLIHRGAIRRLVFASVRRDHLKHDLVRRRRDYPAVVFGSRRIAQREPFAALHPERARNVRRVVARDHRAAFVYVLRTYEKSRHCFSPCQINPISEGLSEKTYPVMPPRILRGQYGRDCCVVKLRAA